MTWVAGARQSWPFCLLSMLLLVPAGAMAQVAQVKVGFVNIARVLQQAPQADDARLRIDEEFAPRQREILSVEREVREAEDRLITDGAMMSASERIRQENELRSLKRELRRTQDEFREDLNVRRNEELSKLQRLVVDVIQELAKSEGYDLMVSEGVLFAGERVDITEKVISRLQVNLKNSN